MVNILGNIAAVSSHTPPVHWFRIAYSRNAFLRVLTELGLQLDALTVEEGEHAMRSFMATYRPQHAEMDRFSATNRTARGHRERVFTRRMQRHDHPVATLRLVFALDGDTVVSRTLDQS